jgi:two-component system cell cycle response regulator DivK
MSTPMPLVLVVDDYQDGREMYAECLALYGFRVAEAENGLEAITKAQSLQPDVILMDLSLPGMDGWEASRRLKADARTRHIPIIAITGHSGDAASKAARKAGCSAFVLKPALPDEVVAELRKALAARAL